MQLPDFKAQWRNVLRELREYVDTQFEERGFTGSHLDAGHLRGTLPTHSHDHGALTGLGDDDHGQYTTDAEAGSIADGRITTHAGNANAHHNQAHLLFGADHSDVLITTPPGDGQVLVWSAVTSKWVPGTAITDLLTDGAGGLITANGSVIYT